jgi:curved DNA-binding protein CbpA
MAEPKDDYYAILGVSPTAPPAAIRAAFHRIAWECHPDRQGGEELHERFIRAAAAFRVVSDPQRRANYDRQRALTVLPLRQPRPQRVKRVRRRRATTGVLMGLFVMLPMLVSWVDVRNYLMATYALALLFVVVLARLSRDI